MESKNCSLVSHIGGQQLSAPSVFVIGGGISGIAAARALCDASFKVVLFESRNRLGGRVHTDHSFGFPVDMGASWLHGVCNENPLAPLIRGLGLTLYRTSGDNSVLYDHDLERVAGILVALSRSVLKKNNIKHLHHAFYVVFQSWISKKFMTGCVVLFPVAITFFITWWFVQFVDGFFSPLYASLGINIFGLGFVTSLIFVFFVGVFVSSWMGATVFWLGEWLIKRMPFVRHIYSASKQISTAISPDQNTTAFKEVAIIRHPRIGEYAFGFITSSVVLQRDNGDEELCSVYVPTNHLYIGDIFLVNSEEIIRPNLSIREGIEIIVSGGMTMPQLIAPVERIPRQGDRVRLNRIA